MSRAEQSAFNQARDEHLRLALPGWGAPGARFCNIVKLSRVEHARDERARIQRELRAYCDVTLAAITIGDVVQKYRTTYSRARIALQHVRNERRMPPFARGGLRVAA